MDPRPHDDELEEMELVLGDGATPGMNAREAVDLVDKLWYRGVAKRGQWMDLIGDYAGSERFIVEFERFGCCIP
ncbi:hypothetical protein OF83DRAFT_1153626 [Amylostereum chailletii]|nr:hypothetical protein OF83DRAFT_1153626 [Amylostereum chailletii]